MSYAPRYCRKCDTMKTTEDFSPARERPDGLRPVCKACVALQARKYAPRNTARKRRERSVLDVWSIVLSDEFASRYWSMVRRNDARCWDWLGSTYRGYGQIAAGPFMMKAHRVAWAIHHRRPFPRGKLACHSCDNPNCVNPNHIWAGSSKDNLVDASRKGRLKRSKPSVMSQRMAAMTHCKRGHPFDEVNTRPLKNGWRECRECVRIRRRKPRPSQSGQAF